MRTLRGETMGTSWSATIVDPPASAEAAIGVVLAEVIAQMSHWDAGSQLSRINRAAPGGWHRIAPAFGEVMTAAIDIAAKSGGSFDPAMGALVDLWGFGPPGPVARQPDADAVATARAASGSDAFEFDPLLLRLRRTRAAHLDLSGIAKGYAVDAVAARLRELGCRDFLIEIGGELVGVGIQPDGQPWWVDVETPDHLVVTPLRVALHNLTIATSGDYRRTADFGSHTIDPRTGRPIANGVASVSVLHQSCMQADGWASALTVLGPQAGMALAEQERLAARMLDRAGGEWISPALQAMLD
ncbi:FAD:protein FMN transferase [Sphingomonas turrisvirgatae]|uniref:FAD:protein FMN transferase n=1 Tax=Sphingomonas turrisvirgatae TaxID=1888892 RepID=UPI001F4E685A|nr:FAD:protein FMN transferase [Sphingomonas turrisvirgatae]